MDLDSLREALTHLASHLSLDAALRAVVVLALFVGVATALNRMCDGMMRRWMPGATPATRELVGRLLRYGTVLLGLVTALRVMGIELGLVLKVAAVLLIGVGLAVQKLGQSVVAGTLLLLERELEPGDIIHFDGVDYTIDAIGLRTTRMRNHKGHTHFVPNYELATRPLCNLTHEQSRPCVQVELELEHGHDRALIRSVLEDAARTVSTDPLAARALILSVEYGMLRWRIMARIDDAWARPTARDQLFEAALSGLQEHGITPGYPHLAVTRHREDTAPDRGPN